MLDIYNYNAIILDSSICYAPIPESIKNELANSNVYVSNTFNEEMESYKQYYEKNENFQKNIEYLKSIPLKTVSPDVYKTQDHQDIVALIRIFEDLNERPLVIINDQSLIDQVREMNADIYSLKTNQMESSKIQKSSQQNNRIFDSDRADNGIRYCTKCGRRLLPGEICHCDKNIPQGIPKEKIDHMKNAAKEEIKKQHKGPIYGIVALICIMIILILNSVFGIFNTSIVGTWGDLKIENEEGDIISFEEYLLEDMGSDYYKLDEDAREMIESANMSITFAEDYSFSVSAAGETAEGTYSVGDGNVYYLSFLGEVQKASISGRTLTIYGNDDQGTNIYFTKQ